MIKLKHLVGTSALIALGVTANAQLTFTGWAFECIDPENESPYSDDYGLVSVNSDLIVASMGVSGTVTYGGQSGPCYAPARTLDAPGRFAFSIGGTGSVQSSFDDYLALTTGAPLDPVGDYCYARVLKGGDTAADSVLFGDGGVGATFEGASKRYFQTNWGDGDVQIRLTVRVIADAARLEWQMFNMTDEVLPLGLLFGAYTGMRTGSPFVTDPETNTNQAHSDLATLNGIAKRTADNYIGMVNLPTTKPVRNERRYERGNPKFPDFFDVTFGQTAYYGMRFQNVASEDLNDATSADLMLVGNFFAPLESLLWDNNMRLHVAGDPTGTAEEADLLLNETSVIQRFPTTGVAPGGMREVIQYIRAPWSAGDYNDPYALVIDAPQVIAADPSGVNGLSPNPMQIRAYVDNQYAQLDREITLESVRVEIHLPSGVSLAAGESKIKEVNNVLPNQIRSIDWMVESDGYTFGEVPITVTSSAITLDGTVPGLSKSVDTSIMVAATPVMRLGEGTNMVGFPYDFADSSFDAITGGLVAGVDYAAFGWDPEALEYRVVSSPKRGVGYWFVPRNDLGVLDLQGATVPSDAGRGGKMTTLKKGWNMISNPYNYALPLGQLIAVVEDSPATPLTWAELVQQGFVAGAMIEWDRDPNDPNTGQYKFLTDINSQLQPHKGYWVFVQSFRAVHLSWPPVYHPGMPGSGRSTMDERWEQSNRNWRLQLAARNSDGMDAAAYVGVVADRKAVDSKSMPKPPMSPTAPVEIAVMGSYAGEPMKMSQALTDRSKKSEWKVLVRSESSGDVTVTWPNLPSIPKNVRMKVSDDAAGISLDMRNSSGYTFRMAEPGTRELTVSMEVGGAVRPMIGNVIVTRPSRDGNSPISINYALSADATVSVRVLSSTGKEVFTITRGRAVNAGENNVTWMLRDNANRAVAPGTYRVEILAESPDGERVRKIVPVNVIR